MTGALPDLPSTHKSATTMAASWDQQQQTTPAVKFEDSPAESFVSTPGDMYPSLFATASSPAPAVMDPTAALTPDSFIDDSADVSALSGLAAGLASTPADSSSTPEKKPVKKRKSWGQVLPEPKTNLPPRKRAKTDDEKEQRRVERVLRNRRAAQSSRERKRLEVEALEQRNQELELALLNAQKANLMLVEELNRFRRDSGVVTRSSSPLNSLRPNPVTLSQELFSSQDGHRASIDSTGSSASLVDDLINSSSQPSATVNPASLSPELAPIAEADEADAETTAAGGDAPAANTSSDLTRHPAAMLCDLQCHQSEDLPRSWLASQPSPLQPILASYLQLQMLALLATTSSTILSACRRPLMQIAMSLKAGFSLPPTPSITKTIIWLVTRPPSSRSTRSTSPSSSTTTSTAASRQTRRRTTATPSQRTWTSAATYPTLRLKSLQKILTCSPSLARPLMDATMEALRLVSEGCDDRVEGSQAGSPATRDGRTRDPSAWLTGVPLPSREVLLALLWALTLEDRKIRRKALSPELGSRNHQMVATTATMKLQPLHSTPAPANRYILKLVPSHRKRSGDDMDLSGSINNKKRFRLA